MVTTDHGGPNHAKFNATRAYVDLLDSRQLVPDVLQFDRMELNMSAMDPRGLGIQRDIPKPRLLPHLNTRAQCLVVIHSEEA